jgi:serine phosphatase RsbU (regulator of sigma subunit)
LNDVRVSEAVIKPGDRVRLGQSDIHIDTDTAGSAASAGFDFRQMNALLAGLRALGSSHVLDEVLAIVLDGALEVSGAERGFILLADESGHLEQRLARVRGGVTLGSAQISQRIPEEVLATGSDRIVTDLRDDVHAPHHAGTLALGIRHVLCTPLRVVQYGNSGGERRIGVLYLDSRERGYLEAAAALQALAAEAAVVIQNARLYQQVLEQERESHELSIAADMQRALLPPGDHTTQYAELSAYSTPCRAVGGDLFDYVERPDGITFTVADVAGKGTSAALLTAVVQGLFAAEAFATDPSGMVMRRVNRALCRRAVASRFVTAFHGHLASDGTLSYCNAGHNPPFLVTAAGLTRLDIGGTVLGVFDGTEYDSGTIQLAPGDSVVVFSDGVTEAIDRCDEEFGDQRLEACIVDVRTRPAREVLQHIQQSLATFCEGVAARDDVTLLVLKRH